MPCFATRRCEGLDWSNKFDGFDGLEGILEKFDNLREALRDDGVSLKKTSHPISYPAGFVTDGSQLLFSHLANT